MNDDIDVCRIDDPEAARAVLQDVADGFEVKVTIHEERIPDDVRLRVFGEKVSPAEFRSRIRQLTYLLANFDEVLDVSNDNRTPTDELTETRSAGLSPKAMSVLTKLLGRGQ